MKQEEFLLLSESLRSQNPSRMRTDFEAESWEFKMINQIKSSDSSILFHFPLLFVEIVNQKCLNYWFRRLNSYANITKIFE